MAHPNPMGRSSGKHVAHWLAVAGVSIAFESLFVHHGIAWLFDEGWPLYAAMRLHQGGTLYADTFFLFPPGHVWPAWIAYALDPPGVVLARIFYSAFNVAACLALYGLGRRLMPAPFALLAALLLAVAAPRSHLAHLLFGYRYTVFALLALLAFGARQRGGGRGWMFVAGLWTGVALAFRLTPAFAVSCGIGVAAFCARRDWRESLRDLGAFAAGVLAAVAPLLAHFAAGVGLDALWNSAVVRILPLQAAQSKPIPGMLAPAWSDREGVSQLFVALQYRLYPVLYGVYLFVLARRAWTSFREARGFGEPLLLAVVIFGAVFFLRTLGRSDEHHLTSALPPTCLLLAHTLHAALARQRELAAVPGQGLAHQRLAHPKTIERGGVEMRDALVQRRQQQPLGRIGCDGRAVRVANVHAAQADGRNLEGAELSLLHGFQPAAFNFCSRSCST